MQVEQKGPVPLPRFEQAHTQYTPPGAAGGPLHAAPPGRSTAAGTVLQGGSRCPTSSSWVGTDAAQLG